jgi:hypothetical protein
MVLDSDGNDPEPCFFGVLIGFHGVIHGIYKWTIM